MLTSIDYVINAIVHVTHTPHTGLSQILKKTQVSFKRKINRVSHQKRFERWFKVFLVFTDLSAVLERHNLDKILA